MENKLYKIVSDGKTNWNIIVSENIIPSEKYAAEELQNFIRDITGAVLPIVDDNKELQANSIILGNNRHLKKTAVNVDYERLGSEGFVIKTEGNYLAIAGGSPRGTLYGVYTFLEKYLGCRWFSSKVSHIPKRSSIEIPEINDEQIPVLFYREPFYTDAFDGDWAARNKMNGQHHRLEEKHGGKIMYSKRFVHTFNVLVPPKEYFDTHPEYFSEVDGKRISENTQLCLTNPDVFEICLNKVREWIREEPEATIFSISQNDCANPCQCEKCRAIDEEEGSHSGTLLRFVNKIAEVIEKEYPDKYVDTLAYWYTRKPPKYTKPNKNIIIRLCNIECCFVHPLDSNCEKNKPFVDDMKKWAKICDKLYVWDYVVNFGHYLMPFPNLRVLQTNIKFFINNSVKSIFEQGNYCESGKGEFAELRAYVLAKLLWNPDYDVDTAINEFLGGYFGMAAAPMRQYIDMMHDRVEELNDFHIGIFDPPSEKFFTPEIVEKAEKLFERALALADDEEVVERVRIAHMQIKYVKMQLLSKDDSALKTVRDEFFKEAKELGISRIREWTMLDETRQLMEEGKI